MSKVVSLTNPDHKEVTVSMATYLSYDVDHTLILCFVRFEIAYVNVKDTLPDVGWAQEIIILVANTNANLSINTYK